MATTPNPKPKPVAKATEKTATNSAHIQPVRDVKLAERDLHLTESVQAAFTIYPVKGTTREDVLKPTFWSHVAAQIPTMSEIRVMPRGSAWYGIYLVRYSGALRCVVEELLYKELPAMAAADVSTGSDGQHRVEHNEIQGWVVIRNADNEIIQDGFESDPDAQIWLAEHLKAMAA